jgi:hypothetical protein
MTAKMSAKKRYRTLEKLQEKARQEIPAVAVDWLAAARREMERLTMAALSGKVTDEEFANMVRKSSAKLPQLLDKLNHEALAKPMEDTMGASAANGIAARMGDLPERRAKAVADDGAWLAAGKGKRCGNSWIPKWKRCGQDDGREWEEATAEDAAVLARLTGRDFKAGARILATPEGIRHAEKGHAHQLQEKDWQQLRGRLFDPRTERELTRSKNNEDGISFQFRRGDDRMEAVFTIHFPHRKSPGELRLKTYAQRG